MDVKRREFLKKSMAASAAVTVGMSLPLDVNAALLKEAGKGEGWKWDKAVCRFCGTGCGIMVPQKMKKL